MGVHGLPTVGRRPSHCLLNKFDTKMRGSVFLKYRESVPLPLFTPRVQGIETYRSDGPTIYHPNQVDRVRFPISEVLIRLRKNSLLVDKHVVSNSKMLKSTLVVINSQNSGDVKLMFTSLAHTFAFTWKSSVNDLQWDH